MNQQKTKRLRRAYEQTADVTTNKFMTENTYRIREDGRRVISGTKLVNPYKLGWRMYKAAR